MNFSAFDYQEGMISHLKDHDHGALFAGMGLGKTVTTLRAYVDLMNEGKMKGVLIIAPLRVCTVTWVDQIKRWGFSQHLKVANLRTKEGMKQWEEGSADVFLVNFELISGRGNKKGFLDQYVGKNMPVDTLLIDELSCLKANSKRTKSVIKARKHFKRVHALTGTPSPNSVMDLFFPMKVLDGGERLGKFITHFRDRFFDSDYMGYNYTPKRGAVEEIQRLISDICLVRRSEDHLEIPDCEFIDIDVCLPAKVMKRYKELQKHLVIALKDQIVDASSAATLINKLQQFTSGTVYDDEGGEVGLHTAKHKALAKILSKEAPVLVLTRYRSEMTAILEAFPEAQQFDEKRMDDWKAGKIPVWVANPASMSHGIDGLQDSCSTIVWMSLTYSLEQYSQTNARILRTGQSKGSKVYRVLASETIDWTVASALETKDRGQSSLMSAVGMLQRAIGNQVQTSHRSSKQEDKTRDRFGFFL
jgi:superfamily II DNA or RNA helicase